MSVRNRRRVHSLKISITLTVTVNLLALLHFMSTSQKSQLVVYTFGDVPAHSWPRVVADTNVGYSLYVSATPLPPTFSKYYI